MGKFSPKALTAKKKNLDREKNERIKESLREKELLTLIFDGSTLIDGILLFGSHKGERISELMNSFQNASYVTGYLSGDRMLPKKFRKQIQGILDSFDPFMETIRESEESLDIREIFGDEDTPW